MLETLWRKRNGFKLLGFFKDIFRMYYLDIEWTVEVVVSGTFKGGTLFKLEALQERAARVWSTEASLREENMLVDDIMAVIQTVIEEKANIDLPEEDQQAQPSPGPSMPQQATDLLEVLHLELRSMIAPACMDCPRLRQKFWQRCLPSLDGTVAINHGTSGFWVRAIFLQLPFRMTGSRGWASSSRRREPGSQARGTQGQPGGMAWGTVREVKVRLLQIGGQLVCGMP